MMTADEMREKLKAKFIEGFGPEDHATLEAAFKDAGITEGEASEGMVALRDTMHRAFQTSPVHGMPSIGAAVAALVAAEIIGEASEGPQALVARVTLLCKTLAAMAGSAYAMKYPGPDGKIGAILCALLAQNMPEMQMEVEAREKCDDPNCEVCHGKPH